MCQRITKLTTFVDGTWCLRCYVAGDSTWEGELLTQLLQTIHILTNVRIYLAVGTFQIGVCYEEVSAVSRTRNQDHILIVLLDDTI